MLGQFYAQRGTLSRQANKVVRALQLTGQRSRRREIHVAVVPTTILHTYLVRYFGT